MRAIVILTAFALATPAFAQPTPSLQIETASWGYAGQRKDVKADVGKLCDGKSTCSFMVKNETFTMSAPADPAPGEPKGLIMVWKCADATKKDQFPENKTALVACR
jgi:hypothetical protein